MTTATETKTTEARKIDWDKYQIRCSSLPTLMTNPKLKSEVLSETAKSMLREVWIEETFGRKKFDTSNKYTEKGLFAEQDSLDLVSRVLGLGFIAKNKENLFNDYIKGTPDVTQPILLDVKSSWDIWTFSAVDEKKARKDYFWQLFGYMVLLGVDKCLLTYALVDTPENIRETELYRLTQNL